jgi:pimeloyl-ACP methyl ester carboxylesterase
VSAERDPAARTRERGREISGDDQRGRAGAEQLPVDVRSTRAEFGEERERAGAEEAAVDDDYGNPDPEWLRIDWRRHLRRVELPGATVRYVELGQGEPIVFVHGLSGCWQNWLENIPDLARRHRCLALDLPGFGSSPLPSWQISIPAYGRLLHDFCERLGISACALVGNSMGGFIGTEAAISAPGRFNRLVLVSAAGITWAKARQEPARMIGRAGRVAAPLLFQVRKVGLVRPRARQLAFGGIFHYPNRLRPELLYEQMEPALQSPGFPDAIRTLIGYDIRERLAEIEVPTLIVWGRDDRLVPLPAAYSYQRRIPGSRLVVFERTGHLPQLERPARFNRLVEEFIGA